jgi:hypothetical protein
MIIQGWYTRPILASIILVSLPLHAPPPPKVLRHHAQKGLMLRVLEKMVLRRIFGLKRDEVLGGWTNI